MLSGPLQIKLAYVCHKTLVFLDGDVCSSMHKASGFTVKTKQISELAQWVKGLTTMPNNLNLSRDQRMTPTS